MGGRAGENLQARHAPKKRSGGACRDALLAFPGAMRAPPDELGRRGCWRGACCQMRRGAPPSTPRFLLAPPSRSPHAPQHLGLCRVWGRPPCRSAARRARPGRGALRGGACRAGHCRPAMECAAAARRAAAALRALGIGGGAGELGGRAGGAGGGCVSPHRRGLATALPAAAAAAAAGGPFLTRAPLSPAPTGCAPPPRHIPSRLARCPLTSGPSAPTPAWRPSCLSQSAPPAARWARSWSQRAPGARLTTQAGRQRWTWRRWRCCRTSKTPRCAQQPGQLGGERCGGRGGCHSRARAACRLQTGGTASLARPLQACVRQRPPPAGRALPKARGPPPTACAAPPPAALRRLCLPRCPPCLPPRRAAPLDGCPRPRRAAPRRAAPRRAAPRRPAPRHAACCCPPRNAPQYMQLVQCLAAFQAEEDLHEAVAVAIQVCGPLAMGGCRRGAGRGWAGRGTLCTLRRAHAPLAPTPAFPRPHQSRGRTSDKSTPIPLPPHHPAPTPPRPQTNPPGHLPLHAGRHQRGDDGAHRPHRRRQAVSNGAGRGRGRR
jgi:hypothetical protein